jgi:hypothetical protein
MTTTFTIAIDWDRNNFSSAQDDVTARQAIARVRSGD